MGLGVLISALFLGMGHMTLTHPMSIVYPAHLPACYSNCCRDEHVTCVHPISKTWGTFKWKFWIYFLLGKRKKCIAPRACGDHLDLVIDREEMQKSLVLGEVIDPLDQALPEDRFLCLFSHINQENLSPFLPPFLSLCLFNSPSFLSSLPFTFQVMFTDHIQMCFSKWLMIPQSTSVQVNKSDWIRTPSTVITFSGNLGIWLAQSIVALREEQERKEIQGAEGNTNSTADPPCHGGNLTEPHHIWILISQVSQEPQDQNGLKVMRPPFKVVSR